MALRNSPDRYGSVAQALHWIVVALLALQFTLGLIAYRLPIGPAKLGTLARHKSVGLTILALVALRVAWRVLDRPPPLPAMPQWQQVVARASHVGLYALLFAMPVSGWIMSSASNYPVSWFGFVQLPDLVSPDPQLKTLMRALHASLASLLAVLIGVHVGAAFRHQFHDRDGLMYRMLPWRPR